MTSVLNVDTIADKAGTSASCTDKATGSKGVWSNFNGSGTVATRDSFNQSSLTLMMAGQACISYTNSMDDANYSPATCASLADGVDDGNVGIANAARNTTTPLATGSMSLHTTYNTANSSTSGDMKFVCVHIMGDLA